MTKEQDDIEAEAAAFVSNQRILGSLGEPGAGEGNAHDKLNFLIKEVQRVVEATGGTTQDPRLLGEKLDDALRRLDRNSEQIGDPNQGPSIAVRLTQLTSDLDQLQGQLNILDGIIKKTQGETHHTSN